MYIIYYLLLVQSCDVSLQCHEGKARLVWPRTIVGHAWRLHNAVRAHETGIGGLCWVCPACLAAVHDSGYKEQKRCGNGRQAHALTGPSPLMLTGGHHQSHASMLHYSIATCGRGNTAWVACLPSRCRLADSRPIWHQALQHVVHDDG